MILYGVVLIGSDGGARIASRTNEDRKQPAVYTQLQPALNRCAELKGMYPLHFKWSVQQWEVE